MSTNQIIAYSAIFHLCTLKNLSKVMKLITAIIQMSLYLDEILSLDIPVMGLIGVNCNINFLYYPLNISFA